MRTSTKVGIALVGTLLSLESAAQQAFDQMKDSIRSVEDHCYYDPYTPWKAKEVEYGPDWMTLYSVVDIDNDGNMDMAEKRKIFLNYPDNERVIGVEVSQFSSMGEGGGWTGIYARGTYSASYNKISAIDVNDLYGQPIIQAFGRLDSVNYKSYKGIMFGDKGEEYNGGYETVMKFRYDERGNCTEILMTNTQKDMTDNIIINKPELIKDIIESVEGGTLDKTMELHQNEFFIQ